MSMWMDMGAMICPQCRTFFEAHDARQKYCTRRCAKNASKNVARTRRSREHNVRFVGVDGEGVTRNGQHDYVLLSVGDKSVHHNGEPLDHWDILGFLWERFLEDQDAAYVGFYLGYDFAQWLKSLPESRAAMLLSPQGRALRSRNASGNNKTPFPVRVDTWELDMLGMKRFKLRRVPWQYTQEYSGKRPPIPWMHVCDVGAFFQTSLMKAINPREWTEPVVTDEEYALLSEGKARRSVATFDEDMIRYNVLENDVLARLMTRMNAGLVAADLRLTRNQWFGPGQAAQSWLDLKKVPTGKDVRDATPPHIMDLARRSYYGGWFELFRHGTVPGTSYGYDINSAYPDVISHLPCLLHGRWYWSGHDKSVWDRDGLVLIEATVWGEDENCGAMLHRTQDGKILRPQMTRGVYWRDELIAAVRAGVISGWEIHGWALYQPCDCAPPLQDIRALYLQRLGVGKKSPQGKAYRLVYNSAYGKFAQSVGHPKYGNAIYASLITSGCRTRILEAIASHPRGTDDLLMVATDGVYFASPHPDLHFSETELGAWSSETKQNLTLFMPGMYWDDKTREAVRKGAIPVLRSRGVSGSDLAKFIGEIDRQWVDFAETGEFPTVTIDVDFSMVSPNQALARGKWDLCGTLEHGKTRTLSGDWTAKRTAAIDIRPPNMRIATSFKSYPYPRCDPIESAAYDHRFGDERNELMDEIQQITPDGDWDRLMYEALQ